MNIAFVFGFILLLIHSPNSFNPSLHSNTDVQKLAGKISTLEKQIHRIQFNFESELGSTLKDVVNLTRELTTSQAEKIILRRNLTTKCEVLKLASFALRSTKNEISQLKKEIGEMKSGCAISSQALPNISGIAAAVNTNRSFEVALTRTRTQISDRDVLQFSTVLKNEGGHYRPDTGRFRAPVRGSYLLWTNIHLREPSSVLHIALHHQNHVIAHSQAKTTYCTQESVASIMTVVELHTGDMVWFSKHSGSNTIYGSPVEPSQYGGILLRKY